MSLVRVLHVEDSPADAALFQAWLREALTARFEVTRASRLTDALDMVGELRPDVVVLDLGLPEGRGFPVLERFLAACSEFPVVVVSGHDDEATAMECVEAGAQDYWVKGSGEPRLLARTLRFAIIRHAAMRQTPA